MPYAFRVAPIAQLAEAADLKSAQCRFEPDWGHGHSPCRRRTAFSALMRHMGTPTPGRVVAPA